MMDHEYRLSDQMPGPAPDFERGFGVADNPPAPCRTIAITPAVRAHDEAVRRAREVPLAWQRPATAKAIEPKISPIVKVHLTPNKVQKPRHRQENMRFENCQWCLVRLSVAEMEKHRKVCAKRPGVRLSL